MKNYDYNFTNSCWGSHIEALKKAFTKTGELYAVTANGCGEYYPIDKDEAIMKIKDYANRLTNSAKALEKLIAQL